MDSPGLTCWTLIRGAIEGDSHQREIFVRRYAPVVGAYLAARWRHSALRQEIADAVQDVMLECFREGGALGKVDDGAPGGFRAYFYGIVRNVARNIEGRWRSRNDREGQDFDREDPADGDDTPSRVFDRAWAASVLREAARLQEVRANADGADAARRVELLRLRFDAELPIREIARRWEVDAATLHHEYARARREYRDALRTVLLSQHRGSPESFAAEWEQFASLLSR